MPSAAAELQKAIFAALLASAEVAAMVGGRVFDRTPAAAAFPCLSFGRSSQFDWSTDTAEGTEHLLTINAWSKAGGRREALELTERVRARLHDAALTLDGHRLVNLRLEAADIRFEEELAITCGVMRFRAVTEPLG